MNPLSRSLISTAHVVCGEYTTAMPSRTWLRSTTFDDLLGEVDELPAALRVQIVVLESNPHAVFPSAVGGPCKTYHSSVGGSPARPHGERGGVRAAHIGLAVQVCGLTVRQ